MASSTVYNDKETATELLKLLNEDTCEMEKTQDVAQYRLNKGEKLLIKEKFEEMQLSANLVKALYMKGFDRPSLIQKSSIPLIMLGGNCAIQSKSGTGKTVAYAVGILQRMVASKKAQAVVITPTRELNRQVANEISDLAGYVGTSVLTALKRRDIEDIAEEVIVGSPGTLLHLFRDNKISPDGIKIVVVDEADATLDPEGMGAQTVQILHMLRSAQKIFFSATYSDKIKALITSIAPEIESLYEAENTKPEEIKLYCIDVKRNDKVETLMGLYNYLTVAQSIVFVATKKMVDTLKTVFESDMFTVSFLHGDMEMPEREKAVKDFKDARTKVLISTDVFSRGMDIPQVNLILNFDLPVYDGKPNVETYIHRIGRSGRFGRAGFVVDFLSSEQDVVAEATFARELKCASKKFNLDALKDAFVAMQSL